MFDSTIRKRLCDNGICAALPWDYTRIFEAQFPLRTSREPFLGISGKKRRRAQGSRTRSAEQSEGILDPEHADDDAQEDQEGRSIVSETEYGVIMASQIWA